MLSRGSWEGAQGPLSTGAVNRGLRRKVGVVKTGCWLHSLVRPWCFSAPILVSSQLKKVLYKRPNLRVYDRDQDKGEE